MGLRILQLISSAGFFGAEKVMLQLSRSLSDSGYEVYAQVLGSSTGAHKEVVRAAEAAGLKTGFFECRGKFDVTAIKRLRGFIKNESIDIVHSHGYKSNFYGWVAAYGLKVKSVTTCHNWLSKDMKMKFYEIIDKHLLRSFDKVIAVSANLREEILAAGVPLDKVMLIENGIDIEAYASMPQVPVTKGSLGIHDNDLVIGSVGRLSEEKGHEYLIRAFKEITEKMPQCRLLIVGDGPLRESLELLARSLEIQDKVIFTGTRDDIPDLLGMIDIFVMPSLTEGMPMALLEAMAAKKAIIASRVGQIPEIIENEYTGCLVPSQDVGSLSRTIAGLMGALEKRKILGNKAYEKVKRDFSAQKMAQRYEILYEALLNGVS